MRCGLIELVSSKPMISGIAIILGLGASQGRLESLAELSGAAMSPEIDELK